MAFILNIDTALETASVALAENDKIIVSAINDQQKDHAAWLQSAIKKLLEKSPIKSDQLNAIGISNGPGSYTGLRVGLSTAKGLCYALKIPLITINTLEVLAFSVINENFKYVCPMIDARRMEVYTAVYDKQLLQIIKPQALILNEHSFHELLEWHKILFLGNGATKFKMICTHTNAIFKNLPLNPTSLCELTYKNFIGNNFAELAYVEPLYLKEFFTTQKKIE